MTKAPYLLGVLALAALAACHSVLATVGSQCKVAADCGSGQCSSDGLCTQTCTKQADCPVGFDCGVLKAADAKALGGAYCYRSNLEPLLDAGVPPDGLLAKLAVFGSDCSTYSPDPTDPTATCNGAASDPCGAGFFCRSSLKCDPAAYCTAACATDADCPPTMFCGVDTGSICSADSDCKGGKTCVTVPGGTAKVCTSKPLCLKRRQCSPCAVGDQCPAGYLCTVDANGEKFCGQACTDASNCEQLAVGSPYMMCGDAGVCIPSQGQCHGLSALKSVTAPASFCDACRPGFPGDCGDGECFVAGDGETFCTVTCTVDVTKVGSSYSAGTDSCPSGSYCAGGVPANCGNACTIHGICTVDSMRQYLTCYP